MIQLPQILPYYPPFLSDNLSFQKYIVKEYIQLLILDFLSDSRWVSKVSFIGGTNLRLVSGIDRFSEDLDFDCKNFSHDNFLAMTDDVLAFIKRSGITAEFRDKENKKLSAYRRSLYFPELLYKLGLSGHRDERFLIKIECQDQKFNYKPVYANIKGCGFHFSFPVPQESTLLSMKISAMLSRSKGRDFYDVLFLMNRTKPDYSFLKEKCGITDAKELRLEVKKLMKITDMKNKSRDFEHLLFNRKNNEKVIEFSKRFEV